MTGVLVRLGAAAPKTLLPANSENERGFYESAVLIALHDEILASADSNWHDWRAFDPRWYSTDAAAAFRARARALLDSEFGDSRLIALKDPRTCRFVPFWRQVLEEAGFDPRVVIPLRSPLEVAHSLKFRNNFSLTKGLLLWLRHVLDTEAASRDLPRAVIDWSALLSDWRAQVEAIGQRTGTVWPGPSDSTAAEIDSFLEPLLRRQRVDDAAFAEHPEVHGWIRAAYEALRTLTSEPGEGRALAALDEVRQRFDEASVLFGRALAEEEQRAEIQQSEAAAQRTKFAAAKTKRDSLKSQLHGAAAERDRLGSELQAATAERDRLETKLDETVRRADEKIRELKSRTRQAEDRVERQSAEIGSLKEVAHRSGTVQARRASAPWREAKPLQTAKWMSGAAVRSIRNPWRAARALWRRVAKTSVPPPPQRESTPASPLKTKPKKAVRSSTKTLQSASDLP